jgi:hypothetical protein
VSILWAYFQFRVIVWLLRMTGRLLALAALAAVLIAAAPVTLVTAIGLAGAWLRGWPPARLRRAAAWALPMTAVYLAGRAVQARTWQALALAPVHDYATAWHAVAAGRLVTAFVLAAPVAVPAGLAADQWIWSPHETHPAIISRQTWDAAQAMADAHGTSRDDPALNTHPQARRTYLLRGRVRCRPCQRRMYGITRPSTRYYAGAADVDHTYYLCPTTPPTPPTKRRPPATRPPSASAKTCSSSRPGSSSKSASSDPSAPPCCVNSFPPAPPRKPPGGRKTPPGSASGSRRSTPPKTPTSAKSRPSPNSTRTHPP